MSQPWHCGVCEGVNQGGDTCAVCGASLATAVAVDRPAPPAAPPPEPLDWDGLSPSDAHSPPESRPRGLFTRLIDAATRTVERALTASPPPTDEPAPVPEPPPRRRSRLQVRPFPFGLMVTWRSDDEEA